MHSVWSDGDWQPSDVAKRAADKGYGVAVLTDHDSIEGTEEFVRSAKELGLATTTGVELTAYDGEEIHVLAYGCDFDKKGPFRRVLERFRAGRAERFRRIRARLAAIGHGISDEEIAAVCKGTLSRRHLAMILRDRGDVKSIQEAYYRFFRKGAPAFVEFGHNPPSAAVQGIAENGGFAVLAHPGRLKKEWSEVEHLVAELKDVGLSGIETYYATHTTDTLRRCKELSDRYGLLNTNGSDFHRENDGGLHSSEYGCDELEARTLRVLFGL